jgi:hypothetical protein
LVAIFIGDEIHGDILAIRPFVSVTAFDLQGFIFTSWVLEDAFFIAGNAVTCLESGIETDSVNIHLFVIPLQNMEDCLKERKFVVYGMSSPEAI